MNTTYVKPKQRLHHSKKDKKWIEQSAGWYRSACVEALDTATSLQLYKLAVGILDENDYLYVTNPIGTNRPELMGYPARLENYDIISPVINLIMGEKIGRMFSPIVWAKNSIHANLQSKEEVRLIVQELQKQFINYLHSSGLPFEQEQVQAGLAEIQQRVKNVPDTLAIDLQDLIDYIIQENSLFRHYRKGFYDWLVTAQVYSYKDVYKGKICYQIVAAKNLAYMCSSIHDFIKKGEAARIRHYMSVNEIYDRFQDDPDFNEDFEKWLDTIGGSQSDYGTDSLGRVYRGLSDVDNEVRSLFGNIGLKSPEDYDPNAIQVDQVQWRSQVKRGKLRLMNPETGEIETITVDEDFAALPEDDIVWGWYDEIWEAYIFNDNKVLGGRAIPILQTEFPDLLINGRNQFSREVKPKSLVSKGKQFQKSINIIKYRAEQTLAKSLDKIILFPLGLIPKNSGWDEDKLMYYVRAFSFLFFDDTRPNASSMVQAMKELDMSVYQQIVEVQDIVAGIKGEWMEVAGITPQRKGEIAASSGKATTEEAIGKSYTMSEELFLEYEEFEQDEYTDILELSKYAYPDGIQAHFIRPDGTKAFLNIHDPRSFQWSDVGVFVKNGAKEVQKLEMFKAQVQAFAQNQVAPSTITKIIQAGNFSQIHEIMDQLETQQEARMNAAQQQELQIQQSQERVSQAELDYKYYDTDVTAATDLQVALIQEGIAITQTMQKLESNGQSNSPEYTGQREALDKNYIELLKNSTELKKIASQERMNKDNNKTKLANPTSGEKKK